MVCELLDIRCIFVSELVGSALLAMFLVAIVYFLIASKLRFGFDTTVVMSLPLILIVGLAITGFSAIFAFATVFIGLILAWLFNRILQN